MRIEPHVHYTWDISAHVNAPIAPPFGSPTNESQVFYLSFSSRVAESRDKSHKQPLINCNYCTFSALDALMS